MTETVCFAHIDAKPFQHHQVVPTFQELLIVGVDKNTQQETRTFELLQLSNDREGNQSSIGRVTIGGLSDMPYATVQVSAGEDAIRLIQVSTTAFRVRSTLGQLLGADYLTKKKVSALADCMSLSDRWQLAFASRIDSRRQSPGVRDIS